MGLTTDAKHNYNLDFPSDASSDIVGPLWVASLKERSCNWTFYCIFIFNFISSWLWSFGEVFLLWPKISHNDSYGFLMAFQFCIVNYPYCWYAEVCYWVLCVLNSHFIAHLVLSFRIKPPIRVKVDFYRQEKITKILLIEQLQNFMVKVFL